MSGGSLVPEIEPREQEGPPQYSVPRCYARRHLAMASHVHDYALIVVGGQDLVCTIPDFFERARVRGVICASLNV